MRLPDLKAAERRKFARELISEVENVAAVFDQEGVIRGEFRLRTLKHLAGERRTLTVHRENGCAFKVDVARCYFSPRLSTERLRITEGSKEGERVLNMFAGVGPFSIPLAKMKHARVTSCELNKYAAKLHEENDLMNKVADRILVVNADVAKWAAASAGKYDRVLMPHPSQSHRFLSTALSVTKRKGTIHYYRHVLARDEEEGKEQIGEELKRLLPAGASFRARKVRDVGPRWLEMAADIRVS
ncbi:MAG: class I SAM-dependent methyltransferase family protein [Thaumarchaeota archaeon]|nr:class I SAM-dependent methyltransferase family protein [Nitrososphaerota archaeon]